MWPLFHPIIFCEFEIEGPSQLLIFDGNHREHVSRVVSRANPIFCLIDFNTNNQQSEK